MFWNSIIDNTVDLSSGEYYSYFDNMKATNSCGYKCDELVYSPIIFLGSCDMSGPITNANAVWSKVLHSTFKSYNTSLPYIALSRVHSGYDALTRRLFTYCKAYGAPKKVFIVLPRPVCEEIPINGTLVNVTERERYLSYLVRIDKLTPKEYGACLKTMEMARLHKDSLEFQLYKFEQASAMLESICERYKIEISWTPNLSATAVEYYEKWLQVFLKECPYMAQTFAGVAKVHDFAVDGSTGEITQSSIANMFLNPTKTTENLNENLEFLKSTKFYSQIKLDASE
jgi:hypothetical protein